MISSKKELEFYLIADHIMNRGKQKQSLRDKFVGIFKPDWIMLYLRLMRKTDYYRSIGNKRWLYYSWRYNKLGIKLGFTISYKAFGYGLVIPHYGTIVVGEDNHIGNYAVLFTSTCINGKQRIIGDGLYLSTGVKITSGENIGNNVSIAANSVVTKSFPNNNVLLAGMPAKVKSDSNPWYIRDGAMWESRVARCEELKKEMKL